MSLELKSPAEIDVLWEPLAVKLGMIKGQLASYREQARKLSESGNERDQRRAVDYQGYYDDYKRKSAAEVAGLKLALAPLEAEFERRGGWQRYWLCVSDGGHVHYRECHTLRWNSMIAWMPMLSGLDEAGMVEKVGFKACTHCFPSAPLHPAWARSEAEYKRKSADEKLAKWGKGRAMRQKKVDNTAKRLAKMQVLKADVEAGKFSGYDADFNRVHAEYGIREGERDLKWAERELARWDAKRPAA